MFKELLISKKSVIVEKWIGYVLESYSSEASNFLRLEKNQFSNPVGHKIRTNIELIFTELIGELNFEKMGSFLSEIIQIRAIQEFTPSKAVAFVLVLKKIIYDKLEKNLKDENVLYEFLTLESFIDRLALVAFDIYMDYREKVYRIRINQIKSNSYSVINNTRDELEK